MCYGTNTSVLLDVVVSVGSKLFPHQLKLAIAFLYDVVSPMGTSHLSLSMSLTI